MSFDLSLIDGDLKIQSDGSVKTYTDTPKLRQDIIKILLTSINENKVHSWYGCDMGHGLLYKNLPDSIVFPALSDSIIESLDNLIKLQSYQMGFQELTSAEMIIKVLGVSTERDETDPRQLNIKVSVLTKRLTKIEEYFTIIS